MPKGNRTKRHAKYEHLNEAQRAVFHALPDAMRAHYLETLPAKRLPKGESGRINKLQAVEAYLEAAYQLQAAVGNYVGLIEGVYTALRNGEADEKAIQPSKLFKLPQVNGFAITRSRKEYGPAEVTEDGEEYADEFLIEEPLTYATG